MYEYQEQVYSLYLQAFKNYCSVNVPQANLE